MVDSGFICIFVLTKRENNMKESRVIKMLANELARRDYDSLREYVSTMSFDEAFKTLGGHNAENDFFDSNYKSITATIYKENRFKGCCVSPLHIEVWLPDYITPIEVVSLRDDE